MLLCSLLKSSARQLEQLIADVTGSQADCGRQKALECDVVDVWGGSIKAVTLRAHGNTRLNKMDAVHQNGVRSTAAAGTEKRS